MVSLNFFAVLSATVLLSQAASADMYKCAQMIYKGGWFKKYEYKGNTYGANIKKHGLISSTAGSTSETVTASVDPGVSLKSSVSSTSQYSSSWGECAMLSTITSLRKCEKSTSDKTSRDQKADFSG